MNGGRSRTTAATGFAAALGGALVGAWLGFNATEGLAALPTTIAGAAVGANLVLLALDLAWARQAGARLGATELPPARPSPV